MTIKVFTANKFITMNASWPLATAVAVRDGQILEVGSVESLEPWLAGDDHETVDLGDVTVLPGLIDPHLHPVMAAVLLPMHFITAMEWELPWQDVPACPDPESYLKRVAQLEAQTPEGEPFFTWGYHASWHGEMSRKLLDEISTDRPMVVWHRSFHEVYLNTAMLDLMEITQDKVGTRQQIDFDKGWFYEVGLGYAIQKLNRIIMSPEWIETGLSRLKKIVHMGGHTTVGDLAVGLFDYEMERKLSVDTLDQDNVPFRVFGVPHAATTARLKGGHDKVVEHILELQGTDTQRIKHGKHIKVFTDGAFFSQLAMLNEPGYLDGHHGEWLMTPEEFELIVREYWHAGFAIHVHCTGDLGLELALDTLAHLQEEKPRFNHGFTIEHFGFSNPEQVSRMRALGAMVSANVYYLYELSERYATHGVGYERAYSMARLGTCVANDLTTAIHSDFPMAPATPLKNAYIACSRVNAAGKIACEEEALSVVDALRAITIDAATVLGLQDEIGSIRAGKSADFTVIDRDPLEEGEIALKEAKVLATVFAGEVYTCEQS
jgi:predicted amidohydrolase YtcJ